MRGLEVLSNPIFPYRTATLVDPPSSDGVKTRKAEASASSLVKPCVELLDPSGSSDVRRDIPRVLECYQAG